MSEKHTVAMFVQDERGERIQVGWASPKDASGVRTFEYSPGYEATRPKNLSFEDDENAAKAAAPVDASVDSSKDAARVDAAPDAELADDLTDASVELNTGGAIVETADEDEEAEFARLLAEEQANEDADTNVEDEQPLTRRDLRDNEN